MIKLVLVSTKFFQEIESKKNLKKLIFNFSSPEKFCRNNYDHEIKSFKELFRLFIFCKICFHKNDHEIES